MSRFAPLGTNSFRVGLAALVGTAAALVGSPAPANAAPTSAAADQSSAVSQAAPKAVSKSAAVTRAEQKRITRYWTTARMRKAKSGEALIAGREVRGSGRVVAGAPRTVSPTAPSRPDGAERATAGGYTWTGGGAIVKTTGKVFFTLAGRDYVCSGSAVTSTNKDTVATAGHCVNEGPGAFATNWAFVPGYNNGSRPYGTFTARKLYTTSAWANSGDYDFDVAFAVMNTLNGKHLTDVVGAQGIAFNQARGKYMYAFGYPAGSPYNGEKLIYCRGTVYDDYIGDTNDQGMDCDMTGGSSGGPWLYNFNTSTGRGTVNSVTSFGYNILDDVLWGPYFGSTVQSVYNTAAAA